MMDTGFENLRRYERERMVLWSWLRRGDDGIEK